MVVLIARGMMDTRLVTWNTFHGARTGDVDAAARSLRDGLASLASAHGRERRQVLAGVGYSMGERAERNINRWSWNLLPCCGTRKIFVLFCILML